jgi:pyruvate dehydrogenase E2 component (dihydrolipoamide acetyltransferase)
MADDTGRGTVTHEELTRLRQTVARRAAESKATAPDAWMTVEVDMEQVAGEPLAWVVKAAGLALRDFPRANGAYRDGRFERYSRVNVGVAVPGGDAFVVPTIFDADRKSVEEIAADARSLAERAAAGELTSPELSGGTFTIACLAVRRFAAVLTPPQAAVLAVGEVAPRAVVRDGAIVARRVAELTLVTDHRILYGAEAAAFLDRIRSYLEAPGT